ncbi:MAG TPA: pyridoxamine 5'-phosphate oxidase family protein [Pseudonocardiaceae bacterium]|nr:pyridoxamine 5'-phosphate oxidase family protein [Pseudonocardiaceae bacterium]
MSKPTDRTAESRELDRGECLRLIAKGVFGRIVFTDAAMPTVQLVSYLLDGDEIIFRAINGSKLAATRHSVVAFQTDEIDPHTHSGWSVVGIGQAYEVTNSERLADLAERQTAAWASAPAAHVIAMPLHRLTGHRLHLDRQAG